MVRKWILGSSAVCFLLIWGFVVYMASQDPYVKKRTYACTVLAKLDNQYTTQIHAITHFNRDFILILSSEGKNFSLDVSPTTWATCKEGDTLLFTIAPYQLDEYQITPLWGICAVLLPVYMGCVLLIMYLAIPED